MVHSSNPMRCSVCYVLRALMQDFYGGQIKKFQGGMCDLENFFNCMEVYLQSFNNSQINIFCFGEFIFFTAKIGRFYINNDSTGLILPGGTFVPVMGGTFNPLPSSTACTDCTPLP